MFVLNVHGVRVTSCSKLAFRYFLRFIVKKIVIVNLHVVHIYLFFFFSDLNTFFGFSFWNISYICTYFSRAFLSSFLAFVAKRRSVSKISMR